MLRILPFITSLFVWLRYPIGVGLNALNDEDYRTVHRAIAAVGMQGFFAQGLSIT
jgi:hypothetical protein